MKLIRIIPNLIIKEKFLVKGYEFANHKYVGDVYNAVKIFSEKKAHEIIINDITARENNTTFDLNLIKKIKNEIFIPLTIGGGINNIDQISKIIDQGVEKVSLNSILNNNVKIIEQTAKKFGSQSVVVSIDTKKINNEYKIFYENGKKQSEVSILEYLKIIENSGAGEIILTSINNEGKRNGFDLDLYELCQNQTFLPIVANGGAENINSFIELFDNTNLASASAGATFVFYGSRKAVLINYPSSNEIMELMKKYEHN